VKEVIFFQYHRPDKTITTYNKIIFSKDQFQLWVEVQEYPHFLDKYRTKWKSIVRTKWKSIVNTKKFYCTCNMMRVC